MIEVMLAETLVDRPRRQVREGLPLAPAGGARNTPLTVSRMSIGERLHLVGPTGFLGLATCDFPFIRYRTGDVAVLETVACACGRGLR